MTLFGGRNNSETISEENSDHLSLDDFVPPEHVHCLHCHRTECGQRLQEEGAGDGQVRQQQLCPMERCPHCSVPMHRCKLDDHLDGRVCSRMPSKCPNAIYGCTAQLRRHLIARHLQHCPCSLVYCPFIRNRQFHQGALGNSEVAKKMLKRIAKGQCEQLKPTVTEEELLVPDVAFARIDQAILERFFRTDRGWRHRLRPAPIPPSELPVKWRKTESVVEDIGDSSDEERREIERQNRKVREPFSGCRLCRLNPGSQHLHELGSLRQQRQMATDKDEENGEEGDKSKLDTAAELDPLLPKFNRTRGLLVSAIMPFLGVILDEHYLRTNFPIWACPARFVRRDQFHAHYRAHLALDDSAPATFFARCPNWQAGCSFRAEARKPANGGVLRFNPFLGCCVLEPMAQLPVQCRWPYSASTLDQMSAHFFTLLAVHLDDASLRALTATCRRMRTILPQILEQRLVINWEWTGTEHEGRRTYSVARDCRSFAPVHDFGSCDRSTELIVQPLGPLVDHLQQCPHRDVHDLGTQRIDLRKWHGSILPSLPTKE